MARVLGACRESGRGEESVSIRNQRERIARWAAENGHTVARVTVDKATSGGIRAAEREDLGPWLTEPGKLAQWDILVATKLDRGWRSVYDFTGMVEDTSDPKRRSPLLGKKLVSIAEDVNLATPEGELMATQLVAFGQFERKRGGQRRREAAEIILDAGRWNGGRVPFGYTPSGSRGNYRLVLHEVNAPIVRGMVADAISGTSLLAIAAELNEQGIRSPLGRPWRDTSIRRILTSPTLVGHVTRMKGSVVTARRGKDGQPISFTDQPLITPEEFHQLQGALHSRSRHRGLAQARQQLYRVAFCAACSPYDSEASPRDDDALLYGHTRVKGPAKPGYYTCKRCGWSVRQDLIEGLVESLVLDGCGLYPLTESKVVPGDDHGAEIARLERQAETRRELLADAPDDDDLASSLAVMEGKIAVLRTMHEPDTIQRVAVAGGTTVDEHWALLDRYGRGQWLRQWGAVAYASRRTLILRIPNDPANPAPGHLTVVAGWN